MMRWMIGLGLVAVLGCSAPKDRETAVRETISKLEEAAEGQDLDALSALLTEGFRGRDGLDARGLRRTLQAQYLRQRSVHALVRIRGVQFPRKGRARVRLTVAVGGTPLPEDSVLEGLRGDVFRVDLELEGDDGPWKVDRAHWRRAGEDDLRE